MRVDKDIEESGIQTEVAKKGGSATFNEIKMDVPEIGSKVIGAFRDIAIEKRIELLKYKPEEKEKRKSNVMI